MSRTCMYCGRELAKGEHCSCPQSVKMREERAKTAQSAQTEHERHDSTNDTSSYQAHTTHTAEKNEKPPKKSWKEKFKKRSRPVKNRAYRNPEANRGAVREFFGYILSCLKSPVYMAQNPGYVPLSWILILVGIQGFVVSMALFISDNAIKKGLIGLMSMALGFKGVAGWKNLAAILLAGLSGTVMGYIQFFVLCGIFFLMGKLLLRSLSPYKEYMERFAPCTIPLTIVGLFGIVFAVFSAPMYLILILGGAVCQIILLYESLRAHWHVDGDFMMYNIVTGLFVYAVLCYNIYKLFVM